MKNREERMLRIAGTTSAEGINVGGIRTLQAFSASPDKPLTVEITRAFHGGRATQAELGVILWRSMDQFVYLREPLESLFKDWNHYQSWQVVVSDGRRPSARLRFTDVSDEDAFLAAHPQPPLGRYDRIEVPYADCIDRRVGKLLSGHQERRKLHRPESYGKNLLDLTEPR